MASRILSQDDIALGRAVLLATEALSMNAEGALWLYDRKDDEWRYFLITSIFDRLDPREVYLCLNEALSKILSAKEASDLRLYIAAPSESMVTQLQKQIRTGAHVSEPQKKTVTIDGIRMQAFVYRLAARLETDQAKRTQRRFRRSCREVAAAI